MNFADIGLGLAFLAGWLLSYLPACFPSSLPMLDTLAADRLPTPRKMQSHRWIAFSHGLAFVLGFSAVFILLAFAVSALGGILYD